MLPYPMLSSQTSHSPSPSLNFSSLRTSFPRPCRYGAPAPRFSPCRCSGGSSDPRPSQTRPLRSPCVCFFRGSAPNLQTFQHSNLPTSISTIPFRITSPAHPRHLTPIGSYSYKKQGRGLGYSGLPSTQALPLFSTVSKHPTHRSSRNSILVMRLLHTSRHTRGGGIPSSDLLHFLKPRPQRVFPRSSVSRWGSQSWLSSSGAHRLRSSPRGARTTSSLRISADSVYSDRVGPRSLSRAARGRYSFPLFAFQPSTLDCQPLPSQRTSTLPPLIYGIIPPHRGMSASASASRRIPVRRRGGFSD